MLYIYTIYILLSATLMIDDMIIPYLFLFPRHRSHLHRAFLDLGDELPAAGERRAAEPREQLAAHGARRADCAGRHGGLQVPERQGRQGLRGSASRGGVHVERAHEGDKGIELYMIYIYIYLSLPFFPPVAGPLNFSTQSWKWYLISKPDPSYFSIKPKIDTKHETAWIQTSTMKPWSRKRYETNSQDPPILSGADVQ